ncbi:MAG: DNA-binding response regulator [Rhodospirillaceae bacterium]|nr:DNA-binding response regulator [Rhodospirillaceae bacterium]
MAESHHVLIVDDDGETRELLARYLGRNGYTVSVAGDGDEMEARLAQDPPVDLIVLDLMLPGRDGLDLTRAIRVRSSVPIVMLTARGDDTDRIVGLEIGADDYLPKPFNPRELLARIRTVLRRAGRSPDSLPVQRNRLRFAGWEIDLAARDLVSPAGVNVPLSAGEFDLLAALVEHPRQVLSRDELLDLTRGRVAAPFDRSVDVQIGRLRRRLEDDPRDPRLIKTVRGGGYMLAAPVEAA